MIYSGRHKRCFASTICDNDTGLLYDSHNFPFKPSVKTSRLFSQLITQWRKRNNAVSHQKPMNEIIFVNDKVDGKIAGWLL